MAAYAIISGFKGDNDKFGKEVARGLPGDMLRKLRDLCEEENPEYDRLEVVHSRRGRIRRRKPSKEAEVAKKRAERAKEAAKRAEEAAKRLEARKKLVEKLNEFDRKAEAQATNQAAPGKPKEGKAKAAPAGKPAAKD